jgi:hypothetical protein
MIEMGKRAFESFSDDRCDLSVQKTGDLERFALDIGFSRWYKDVHRGLHELTSKSRLREGFVEPLILAMGIKTDEVILIEVWSKDHILN